MIWRTEQNKWSHPLTAMLCIVLPHTLLLILLSSDYYIVEPLLDPAHKLNWLYFFGSSGVATLGIAIFSALEWRNRRHLTHYIWPLLILALYSVWTLFFIEHLNRFLPANVPFWMMDHFNLIIYPATFMTPGCFYALVLLAAGLTPREVRAPDVILNSLLVIGLPVVFYLIGLALPRLFDRQGLPDFIWNVYDQLLPLIFVAASLVFFLVLVRLIWILFHTHVARKLSAWHIDKLLIVIFGLVLPMIGLLINHNGSWLGLRELSDFFGDFHHPAFYTLAVLNGLTLLFPRGLHPLLDVCFFILRCVGFAFSTYFLLVFLPWMPIAILAIIAVGLGFIMLTPIVLFGLHTREISLDIRQLRERYSPRLLLLIAACGFSVLPLIVSARYMYDRAQLFSALDYLYTPDYAAPADPELDRASIANTLQRVRNFKESKGTPYLDGLFRYIVLDNLTLSEARLETMEKILTGITRETPRRSGRETGSLLPFRSNTANTGVGTRPPDRTGTELESMRVRTERRVGESFYRTQVELRIISNMGFEREYYTEFNLPSGVYISDHYLMIDGRREAGIFSEKRSALWVYHRITEGRRDPGLLYYTAPGRPALHVFPVHTTAPRVTGFELIHRGPFTLQIDQHSAHIESPVLEMDAATVGPLRIFTNQEWSDLRERLKRAQPRQLHIALDCSLNARESEVVEQYTDVLQSIDALRNTDQSMRISCVDHASRTIIIKGRTTTDDIRKALSDLRPESAAGGFFLGRLIARDLFTLVREPENVTAPVYLIVAPSSTRAHFIEDLRQFQQVNAIELPAYVLHLQPVRSNETTSESTQPDARQRENTRSTTDTRAPTDTQQPMDTEQHRENRTIDSTTKVLPLNLLNDAVQTTDTALVAAARNQRLRPITLNDLITRLQSESAEKNSEFQKSKSDAATGLQLRFTDRDDLVQHYNFNAEPQPAQSDLYEQALLLDGLYRHHVLHPNEETVYRAVLRQSFAHRILTPLTASIALENEAQKRALLRKQEAALAGHSGLELEEKPTAMDEPDWVYLLALIFIMWLYHQRHRIAHYWRRVQPHH